MLKRVLVYKASGDPVQRGDLVRTFRGESCRVLGWTEPHKPESTGRVLVKLDGYQQEFFPSVINAEWKEIA